MEAPARAQLLEAALRLMAANGRPIEGTDRLAGVSSFLADVDAVLEVVRRGAGSTRLHQAPRPPRYADAPPAEADAPPLSGQWTQRTHGKGRTR